jgi:hypothetical protein
MLECPDVHLVNPLIEEGDLILYLEQFLPDEGLEIRERSINHASRTIVKCAHVRTKTRPATGAFVNASFCFCKGFAEGKSLSHICSFERECG